jgi:uncharacterized metal-binding protein YceD (DUF177 family)
MSHAYLIQLDLLRTGVTQNFTMSLSPEFLELQEEEVRMEHPVGVKGEAYLAKERLVLRLDAQTMVTLPCAVCNRMILVPLVTKGVYHTISLADHEEAFFDLRPIVREELLIEIPKTAECGGTCSERETIAPYLKKTDIKHYFPFSDLQ